MEHQVESCAQKTASSEPPGVFLIRPERAAANFEVRLWIIARQTAALHVLRSQAAHWLTFSRIIASQNALDDSSLGLVDACIARGEAVQFRLREGLSELKEIAFEQVFAPPRTRKVIVLSD